METSSLHRMDYRTLVDLARTHAIQVVEARGLDTRNGVRFFKNGREWIALNEDLPIEEKTRALGYLLYHSPGTVAERMGMPAGFSGGDSQSYVLTLCC